MIIDRDFLLPYEIEELETKAYSPLVLYKHNKLNLNNFFNIQEVKLLSRILIKKSHWSSYWPISDSIYRSNNGRGGKPIPLSSKVNSQGHPNSPILLEFLENLDHTLYIGFFTEGEKGKKLLNDLPEDLKNKIINKGPIAIKLSVFRNKNVQNS